MDKKMKAVLTVGPKTSVVKEADMPVMNDDSLLIKLKYVGVCYSEHYSGR